MKLKQYLNEYAYTGDVVDWSPITKDCKPFIKELKGAHNLLLRGSRKSNPGIIKVKPRQDRRPMSTLPKVHDMLDGFFKAKFGWKPRSTGVFCSGSLNTALFYGPVNSVWPIGNFKFLWSPKVSDLFSHLTDQVNTTEHDGWSYWLDNPDGLKAIVDTYTDKNLPKAIDGTATDMQSFEIMIGCKEYYMVLNEDTFALKRYFNIKMG